MNIIQGLRFELKILLLFVALLVPVIFIGSGDLSFTEASQLASSVGNEIGRAKQTELNHARNLFLEQGIDRCRRADESLTIDFNIVVEISATGNVVRSWRQNDSDFEVCMQNLITKNFYIRDIGRSFFTAFGNQ